MLSLNNPPPLLFRPNNRLLILFMLPCLILFPLLSACPLQTVYEDRVLSSSLLSDKKRMKVKLFSPGEGVLGMHC